MSALTSDLAAFKDAPAHELETLAQTAERELNRAAGSDVARRAVRNIMAAYRTPDLADPAAFVDMAVSALEDFSPLILAALASPKHGIVRVSKFPPTIAEMVQWCETKRDMLARPVEMANARVTSLMRAERDAREAVERAKARERLRLEWDAGEAERQRKAEAAAKLVKDAAFKRSQEDAKAAKRREAQAAWMRALFAQVADDAEATERACSLAEADTETATDMELAAPGSGAAFLLSKVRL